ncbi:ribosome biogenesis protein SLX9-domain-containing protein [Lactifluus volemus]|nr:ribosome biogenesis protein SLX9-domain-containing protein [Lactifluus volemus]
MVRSRRSITRAHTASAKPVDRPFAVQDNNAVQHVEIGALKDASADEILRSVNAADADGDALAATVDPLAGPQHRTSNKKERRILKHELFIQRLEASRAPYSKSHSRRLKRKEKEHLAGGGMELLKSALPSITAPHLTSPATVAAAATAGTGGKRSAGSEEGEGAQEEDKSDAVNASVKIDTTQPTRPGQIGEGKGTPLSRSQRRRVLKAERFRQPLILANPEFAANPFETIRTHARNTLIPQQPPP